MVATVSVIPYEAGRQRLTVVFWRDERLREVADYVGSVVQDGEAEAARRDALAALATLGIPVVERVTL